MMDGKGFGGRRAASNPKLQMFNEEIIVQNKIALITGGSRGLGRSGALALAKRGVGVVLTYRSQKGEADAVVAEIEKLGGKAVALALDVGDSSTFAAFAEQVKQALRDKWGRDHFDFLVNNAGIAGYASFAQTTEAQFMELMNVHLKGPFFLTQTLLPLMADGGKILNITTGLTRFAFPGYAAYATMKGAIDVLTRYMAKELGARGISAKSRARGAIETDFGGGAVRDNPQLNAMIAAQTALGRVGKPDDIGGAIASLLADESGWINAQRIEASGGMNV